MNKYQQAAEKEGRIIDPALPHTGQVTTRKTRFTYDKGPMYFLGEHIVKAMEDSGYPAFIWQCYRPPEEQAEYLARGTSKAGPWQSPHQFSEAVDILHPELWWEAPPDYWQQLAACVRIVAERFDVKLDHGHYWSWVDSAHIELEDWRIMRDYMREQWRREFQEWRDEPSVDLELIGPPPEPRPPSPEELRVRFSAVLPKVWAQHIRPPSPPSEPEFQTRRQRRAKQRADRRTAWRDFWGSFRLPPA